MATKPIPSAAGPVAEFARELRKLRDRAGNPSLQTMAAIGYVSVPTLSAVHTGKAFPTWPATRSYLLGCGLIADALGPWLGRWLDVADLVGYRGSRPGDPRASTSIIRRDSAPACEDITTVAQFRARLRELQRWARLGSQAEILRRAVSMGLRLPRATISDMLRKGAEHQLPSAANVRTFLTVCELNDRQVKSWLEVHGKLERNRPRRPASSEPPISPGQAVGVAKVPSRQTPAKASGSGTIYGVPAARRPATERQLPPPSSTTDLPGASVLGGRYRLVERLGAGGMSVVWRGFDEVLGRLVAVKLLSPSTRTDPAFRRRLRAEAQAAARLSHPNITNVYDYGEAVTVDGEPAPFVVMELVDGESLAAVLARARRLPWQHAVRITAEVAAALAAAHSRGIVHRDVTPANVMLTATGAKVVDFGISAVIGENDTDPDGTLVGTPAYLAPERLEGGQVSPATDVYAVGLLIYRTLIGQLPWDVGTTTALLRAHRYVEPDPLPAVEGLPHAVSALVGRCLEKRPSDRPSSAELAHVLAGIAAGAPGAARGYVPDWAESGEDTTILPSQRSFTDAFHPPTVNSAPSNEAASASRWPLRWISEYRGRQRKAPGNQ